MAYDKLVDSEQLDSALSATADAIRLKTEKTEKIAWDANEGFASAVAEIFTDPTLQSKTVTPSTLSQTVKADSGYDGLSQVTVNAMPTATQATPTIEVSSKGLITASAIQTAGYVASGTKNATKQLLVQAAKTVTPMAAEQTAVPSGFYTIGDVKVAGDANLNAENIILGKTIFGVTGTANPAESLDGVLSDIATVVNSNATELVDYALYGHKSITEINLPLVTTIGERAMQGCTGITELVLPLATTLDSASIYGCTKLATVDLHMVTSIGSSAFVNCKALATLIIRSSTVASLGSNALGITNSNATLIYKGTGYIYVPSSLVSSYQSATNWSTFSAQIRAIEDYPDITGGI